MYNTELPDRTQLPSSIQLLRSTVIALIVAVLLLVTVVLPSEYGIDPTGIGRLLGLTQMGEIKLKLAKEAQMDRTAQTTQQPAAENKAASPSPESSTAAKETRTDQMTVTLKPGDGIEIKLEMDKGAKTKYEWTATGGVVNFDLHGDGANRASISYKKGTGVQADSGELIADFDGSHGWFWRNRTSADVTITITATGLHKSIKRVV